MAVGLYDSVPPGPIAMGYKSKPCPWHPSQSVPGIHSTAIPFSQQESTPRASACSSAGPSVFAMNFRTSPVVMTGSNFLQGHRSLAGLQANLPLARSAACASLSLSDVCAFAPCPHLQMRGSFLLRSLVI